VNLAKAQFRNMLDIREYRKADDERFVYKTWLDSMRCTSPIYKRVRDWEFFRYFRKVIDGLLERGAVVLIAAEKDSPSIYGYMVYEPDVKVDERTGIIHWIYVKAVWRRLGVATALIEHAGIDPNGAYYTMRTNYELSLPSGWDQSAAKSNWVAVREARIRRAAEVEAKGQQEGDTRAMLNKWPGAVYCPFLLWPREW
jgi:GNAT superfamily N-acetyltransferase